MGEGGGGGRGGRRDIKYNYRSGTGGVGLR